MNKKHRSGAKNRHYQRVYKVATCFRCANPDCRSGKTIHAHHVTPISKGGADAMWNLVPLCQDCHYGLGVHGRKWKKIVPVLFLWKCKLELRIAGFVLDEKEPDFRARLASHLKIVRKSQRLSRRADQGDC